MTSTTHVPVRLTFLTSLILWCCVNGFACILLSFTWFWCTSRPLQGLSWCSHAHRCPDGHCVLHSCYWPLCVSLCQHLACWVKSLSHTHVQSYKVSQCHHQHQHTQGGPHALMLWKVRRIPSVPGSFVFGNTDQFMQSFVVRWFHVHSAEFFSILFFFLYLPSHACRFPHILICAASKIRTRHDHSNAFPAYCLCCWPNRCPGCAWKQEQAIWCVFADEDAERIYWWWSFPRIWNAKVLFQFFVNMCFLFSLTISIPAVAKGWTSRFLNAAVSR